MAQAQALWQDPLRGGGPGIVSPESGNLEASRSGCGDQERVLETSGAGNQGRCGVCWEHRMPEVGRQRSRWGGSGSASSREGTENHRDILESLHQGAVMVLLCFGKLTTATLWGMVCKVGGRATNLRQGALSE